MWLRRPSEEGRMWDWPNWIGPGAGALLGVMIAVRVDNTAIGITGGVVVFVVATMSDVVVRRRKTDTAVDDLGESSGHTA